MIQNLISTYTKNPYLISLSYLIIWFVILKIGTYIIEKIILKLTIKTKTDLDNLIIKKSNKPLNWTILLIGIKISINKLPVLANTLKWVNVSINTLIAIILLLFIYEIFNFSFMRVIKKIANRTKTKQNEGLLQLTKSTLQIILITVGIIYILQLWGVAIGPLLTGLGIGGVAIAFALQSSLGNVFGGISIILDKSVNVGDLVDLSGGTMGIIQKIGVRSTKVKTFDNEIVIVPNSKLADSNIKNIAQPEPKSRVIIPFGVAYGSNIEKVKKIVLKEIKTVNGFTNNPEPSVKFLEMADSSLNFKAFFFVESYEQRFAAIDEANTKIYNALNKNKIEIPFPQLDVHMKK